MVSPEDSGSSGAESNSVEEPSATPTADFKKARRRKSTLDDNSIDRLPPHSIEAEQGILGSCMLDPGPCLAQCDREKVTSGTFYDLRHAATFDAMQDCREKYGFDFGLIELQQELKDQGKLEGVGGLAYLASLPDAVPSAANLSYYLSIAREKFILRSFIATCTEIVSRCYDHRGEMDELIEVATHDILKVCKLQKPSEISTRDTIDSLSKMNLMDKTDLLLGNFWLERGGSCVMAASSGIGKSVLEMQMAILWACGMECFGVKPSRPLKSVIIYAENSRRENAETIRSIAGKLGIEEGSKDWQLIQKNVVMRQCYHASGPKFVAFARQIAEEERPDLMWLDPLAAYAGDDISKTTTIAKFLREGLDPIAKDFGFAWFIINHFTKPSGEKKKADTKSDRQHAAAGSYDLMGWARAGIIISEHGATGEASVFTIEFTKRGRKSGSCHPNDGAPSTTLWARHAHDSIFWEQIDPPEYDEPKTDAKGGRPSKVQELITIGLGPVVDSLLTETGKNNLAKMIEDYAAHQRFDAGLSTCKLAVDHLVKTGAIRKTPAGYIKA